MPISREEVLKILRNEKDNLTARWPIASLSLFGSVARNEAKPGSDIDLIIELNGPMGWDFFALQDTLAQLLGTKVDLIPKSALKPRYWERIAPEVVEVLHA